MTTRTVANANSADLAGWDSYGVVILDSQGHITSWTAGAQRLSGFHAQDIVHQHFSCLYADEARAAGLPESVLQHALRDGTYEHTTWRVRRDGSRFSATVRIETLRSATGDLIGFAEIARDNDVLSQLRHDFNNIMQIVGTTLQALRLRMPAGDSRSAELVEILRRNTTSAASMVQQLLTERDVDHRQPAITTGARGLKGLRVLVIEDEFLIAMHIEDVLQQFGCEVAAVAGDLDQALALAGSTNADFALVDVNLQGQRSYAVASALIDRGVPFAFMSGETPTDPAWSHYPIVHKPVHADQMEREIERALRGA